MRGSRRCRAPGWAILCPHLDLPLLHSETYGATQRLPSSHPRPIYNVTSFRKPSWIALPLHMGRPLVPLFSTYWGSSALTPGKDQRGVCSEARDCSERCRLKRRKSRPAGPTGTLSSAGGAPSSSTQCGQQPQAVLNCMPAALEGEPADPGELFSGGTFEGFSSSHQGRQPQLPHPTAVRPLQTPAAPVLPQGLSLTLPSA